MPRHGTSATRGYGHAHRTRTRQLKDAMRDGDPCCRCQRPMYRAELPHIDGDHHGRARILGGELPDALAHRSCNRSAGATLGNRLRGARRRAMRLTTSSRDLPRW